MKKFQGFTVPSQITGVRALVDGGLSLNFHTKELDSTQKVKIMDYNFSAGWLLFSENSIDEEHIPKDNAEYETKTPSQRLRSTLYVLWKQQGEKGDFEVYYRAYIEKLINQIKDKLV